MLNIIKNQLPIKISDKLLVRNIATSDKEDLFEMYRDEKVSKYISRRIHGSLEDTEEQIKIINNRCKGGRDLYLGICEACPEKLIGIIRFIQEEDDISTLTIGYELNKNYWGRGIMPESLSKLIEILESERSCKKLRATVSPENLNSQRCLEKLDFKLNRIFNKIEIVNNIEINAEKLEYCRIL